MLAALRERIPVNVAGLFQRKKLYVVLRGTNFLRCRQHATDGSRNDLHLPRKDQFAIETCSFNMVNFNDSNKKDPSKN